MPVDLVRIPRLAGMNEALDAPLGSASLVTDMRQDARGAWQQARGVEKLFWVSGGGDPLAAVGAVETMAWFSQHGSRDWLVWEMQPTGFTDTSLSLVAFNGSSRSFDVIASGRLYNAGPWQGTQYQAHQGWLYFVNGSDAPSCWDGTRVDTIGFERDAGRPLVTDGDGATYAYVDWHDVMVATGVFNENASTARGLGSRADDGNPPSTSDWLYGYRITWVNARGQESPPSEMVLISGTNSGRDTSTAAGVHSGGGRRYIRIQIPVPPPQARGIRVWRTRNIKNVSPVDGANAECFLAYEFGAAVPTILFDGRPDSELGRSLDPDLTGAFPRDAFLLAFYANRLWTVSATQPDVLLYSTRGYVEQFPLVNRLRLGSDDAGAIRAIKPFRDALVVVKERGIYLVKDDGSSALQFVTLTEQIGGGASRAMVEVPGVGLMFPTTAGFVAVGGTLTNEGAPTRINDVGLPVLETFERRVNRAALACAFAVMNHTDREVVFWLPENGKARPTLGFVYHYALGEWSLREGWAYSCGVETGDHRSEVFLGGGSTETRGVFVLTDTTGKKGRTASLSPVWRSAPIRPGVTAEVRSVRLRCVGFGRTHTVKFYNDRYWRQAADSEARVDLDSHRDHSLWGTALWSASSTWEEYVLGEVVVPIDSLPAGSARELQIETGASRLRVVGMDLEVNGADLPKLDPRYDRGSP